MTNEELSIRILFAVIGAAIGWVISYLRGRVRTLEYTVVHEPVAISSDDAVFGSIRVTWRSNSVTNLFLSRVTLENCTARDYKDIVVKSFTGNETLLLNERTSLSDTSYILEWSIEFKKRLEVVDGDAITPEQWEKYLHSREYCIPVLNRKQNAVMTYLTTVPSGSNGPYVWLDILHEGVRVKLRSGGPQVHGVPIKWAITLGMCSGVILWLILVKGQFPSWLAALICLVVGFVAQSIGASLYWLGKYVKTLLIR